MVNRYNTYIFIIFIFIITFLIYISNGHVITSGDNEPTIRLPISIFEHFSINLDTFYHEYILKNDSKPPYYLRLNNNHIYAEKSTGMAIFISPIFYAIFMYIYDEIYTIQDPEFLSYLRISEKLTATILASLTVCIVFLICQMIFKNRPFSLLISLIYAFGTNHWVTSSQGLWVHGGIEFWLSVLILSILLYENTKLDRYIYISSISAGMVSVIRLDGLIYFFFILLYITRYHNKEHNKESLKYLSISLILIILYYSFNLLILGHLTGGYGDIHIKPFYMFPIEEVALAFLGMFISPGRGLFFYTPILIFSFIGIYFLIKIKNESTYPICLIYLIPAVGIIIFIHTVYTDNPYYLKWYGGFSWGPRYFVDIMPLLIIYLGISFIELNKIIKKDNIRRITWMIILMLLSFSIFTQYVGAFYYKQYWDAHPNIDENPRKVWDLYKNPIAVELDTGPAHSSFNIKKIYNSTIKEIATIL